MLKQKMTALALMGSLTVGPLVGCSSLPGGDKEQGAVIGGVGGALAGAALSKNNRGLGALIGGALGAGGGYLIGANKDKITGKGDEKSREEAIAASERAERNPARVEDVNNTRTADLNEDGFVTLDEVVALQRADLSEQEMVARLERTQQVFELTEQQERYLEDRGVSRTVIREMRVMNQDYAAQTASDTQSPSDRRLDRDLDRDADRIDDTRIERTSDRYDRDRDDARSLAR